MNGRTNEKHKRFWKIVGQILLVIGSINFFGWLIYLNIVYPETRWLWVSFAIAILAICIFLFFTEWYPNYLKAKDEKKKEK